MTRPAHRPPRLDLVTGEPVDPAMERRRWLLLSPAESEALDRWLAGLAIAGEARQPGRTLRRVVMARVRGE